MRLAFAHHGLQFFFLTICVEGRQAVLSRLVEGAKRPELTRAGECVRALWRAVHGLNPALRSVACRFARVGGTPHVAFERAAGRRAV